MCEFRDRRIQARADRQRVCRAGGTGLRALARGTGAERPAGNRTDAGDRPCRPRRRERVSLPAVPGRQRADRERERLLDLLAKLARWENNQNVEIFEKTRLEIARSLARQIGVEVPIGQAAILRFLAEHGPVVLDPFAGSNTTGAIAEQLNRHWLSIEPDLKYIEGSFGRFQGIMNGEDKWIQKNC